MSESDLDPMIVFGHMAGVTGPLAEFGLLPRLDDQLAQVSANTAEACLARDTETARIREQLVEVDARWAGYLAVLDSHASSIKHERIMTAASLERDVLHRYLAGSIDNASLVYARGLLENTFIAHSTFNYQGAAEELALYQTLQPGTRVLLYRESRPSSEPNKRKIHISGGGELESQPGIEISPGFCNGLRNLNFRFNLSGGAVERHEASKVFGDGTYPRDTVATDEAEITDLISKWAVQQADFLLRKRNPSDDQPHYPGFALQAVLVLDRFSPEMPEYHATRRIALDLAERVLEANPSNWSMVEIVPIIETIDPDTYTTILRRLALTPEYSREQLEVMISEAKDPDLLDVEPRSVQAKAKIARDILALEESAVTA